MSKAAIIIVNWNGKHLLKDCFDSLRKQSYREFQVYLVDNNSSDASIEFTKKNYSEIKIIKLNDNYGFAKGNNEGIKVALNDPNIKYIITLNNDTIVDKNWLKNLVAASELHPKIGACASKTLYLEKKDTINSNGIAIYQDGHAISWRGFEKASEYKKIEEIFAPSAVAALYKRVALEKVGLFDDSFFMYHEEVDLAWRLRYGGYASIYVPDAIVYHAHSATSKPFSPLKAYYSERNRIWVVFKNFTWSMILKSFGYTIKRYYNLAKELKNKRGPVAEFTKKQPLSKAILILLKAWFIGTITLPKFIPQRIKIQKMRKDNKVTNKKIDNWFKRFGVNVKRLAMTK
jgi:GT2 family glycosyltransferase